LHGHDFIVAAVDREMLVEMNDVGWRAHIQYPETSKDLRDSSIL